MKTSSFATNCAIFLAGVGTTASALSIANRASLPGGINLSQQCQNALLGIAGNQAANTCLNVQGLIGPVLAISGNPNASVVPGIDSWLKGLCAADSCSNATLTSIASNITSGCQSDISSANSQLGQIVQDLPSIYPTLRDVLCLKSTSNDTLCISNTLLGVQDTTGTQLSLSSATDVIGQLTGQSNNVSTSMKSNILCTDCNKRAFQIVAQNDPAIGSNDQFKNTIASQCGANFLSGPTPTDVAEGTGSAAPTGSLPASLSGSNSGSGNGSNANGAITTSAFASVFVSGSVAFLAGLYTLAA